MVTPCSADETGDFSVAIISAIADGGLPRCCIDDSLEMLAATWEDGVNGLVMVGSGPPGGCGDWICCGDVSVRMVLEAGDDACTPKRGLFIGSRVPAVATGGQCSSSLCWEELSASEGRGPSDR